MSSEAPSPAPTPRPVDADDLARAAAGAHWSPHSVLGAHPDGDALTYRVLKPFASAVTVVTEDGSRVGLVHEYDGVWVGVQPGGVVGDYRVEVTYPGAEPVVLDDPDMLAGLGNAVEAQDLDRLAGQRLADAVSAEVVHRPHPAPLSAGDERIADLQGAAADQDRDDGATARVEL